MSTPGAKPSYNAARRITWLAIGIVVVIAAYSAGWFWVAGQVDGAIDDYVQVDRTESASLDCPGRQVRGYPFRLGVFCDSFGYEDAQVSVQAGAIRSAAQVYNPRRVIVEIDSPVEIADTTSDTVYRLAWDRGRASVITAPQTERMMSFEADDARLTINALPGVVETESVGLHARERGEAMDVAARPRGLRIDPALVGGRSLPRIGIDLDMQLDDWRTTWFGPARSGSGVMNRLAILLTEDRGVIAQGPFSLSPDGLISGVFEVRVVDVPGVLSAAGEAFPDTASQIEGLANAYGGQDGQQDDELSLTITLRDGRIFAGIIPLGRIPPIRL